MDSTRNRRIYTIFLFHFLVFNTTSSHEPSSGNTVTVSSERQLEDISGQRMIPSWYRTSVALHSHNRWQTQMALSKTVYSFKVKEDTTPGSIVGKLETGFESLTPITFIVQEDDGENLFLLNPFSGEFLLSRSLDFEAQRFYILTVMAQLGESQGSSVRVYFNVLDVNDNPPVFRRGTFAASLAEDARVGTCFLPFNVSDYDDGENGALNLRVIGGNEEERFFINPAAILCLNRVLDRERQPFYNLTVTANDCVQIVSLQLTTTVHVIVVVDDVNDNPPLFVSAEVVSVPEDTALHSVIMAVHAEDKDVGSNGEVLYYLNNTSSGTFSINKRSGEIYLEEALDREQVDTLTITVMAADEGSPRMETIMNLTVHVEDANDHDPEFSQSTYSFAVREDVPRGTSVFRVQALDQDVGKNGQVRYRLIRGSPFEVDAVRGVISVMEEVDRERDSNYALIITAVDKGIIHRMATAAINVTVLDSNDFAPFFTPPTLIMHVRENDEDPAQLTRQIFAFDEDLGINSQLTYHLQKGNVIGLMSVTPSGMFQILHSLDRERESSYLVNIVAVDSGLPPLTGTLTIRVIVDDVNDNRPEFTQEVFHTIVPEDSPAGTVFAMITASDVDEGVSGELRYSIEDSAVPFDIEETSGELFTTDVLDRETVAIYRFLVIGIDGHPTHPLSSSVLVTVLIGDINDHWPQFMNSPYVAYLPNEMAPGSVVCALRATDGDTEMNAYLHFSLYGQSSDLFSVHPNSGTVTASSALWRTEDIIIHVHVEDAGENPKFDVTTISIRFQNISDFPEMTVDVLSDFLSEDEPVGTLVAVVSASSVRADPVSFYLASGNFEEMFHVNQWSGALTVDNPLDYESKKEFILLIEARDSASPPFSSFSEIHINIIDVNDNFPQFPQAEYRCEVFENSPPSWICDVLAIDADSSSYGTVQYNITEGNTESLFTIDPEYGLLSSTANLDRENTPEYNLTVEAAELNKPLHKDTSTIIVVVLDRNDNSPRFSQIFLTEVPEDSPVGHTVIQLTATDDDTGPNAVINYSLIDQRDDLPFKIDFTTGDITVEKILDREMQDCYIFKVNANDSAWSISTDVTVVITDVNDNPPVFSDHSYSILLPETKDKELFVLQVLALDADIGKNSDVLYVIEPQNEQFWVNASSGEIYTKQPLALHTYAFQIYQFSVIAFDCGSIPLYSNTTVTVRLEPFNHYPPMILPFPPRIAIPYHMDVGTEVVQFTAIDQDVNNTSVGIKYVFNGGNAPDLFCIQVDSGKVMLNQSLIDSVNMSFTLSVIAKDQGTPSLSSETNITFQITGRNQFPPIFRETDVIFSVPEDLPVGSVIGKMYAEDEDYGPNGAIVYCIAPENPYLPFSVGEASGLLTLIRELDFEKEVIHHIQIQALDGGWFSQTGMLNITVVVVDVNDNPPIFSSSEYTTSVPENSVIGTIVLVVKASDADSDAEMSYSLIAGHVDKFAIDPRNGTITTLYVFDFEHERIFDVTIKASNIDGHALFSLAHIVIQISDVNEFTPTFSQKEYNFSVFKNVHIGTRVGRVIATDYDHGSEGQLSYLMFGQSKYMDFEIDTFSGEIYTTGNLRKRGKSQVVFKVLAKNSGVITGMDVDETLVHISVIDANDPPVFTSALYLANIAENSSVGTSLITVSALDEDSIFQWNSFFFSIDNGNIHFSFFIEPLSGVISINSPLDRELQSVYNLTVSATDNGSPPASGITNVIVTIDDVNDNAPKLTFTDAQVKENKPEGTVVARLNTSDSDAPPNGGPFTYRLVNSSKVNAFSLTPDGVLFTTQNIDREKNDIYHILVAVTDAGTPPLSSTTTIHIKIVDENDSPSQPRNIVIEVKYFGSSFEGGMIGHVHPEDKDESDAFNCTIKSGQLNMFLIPNGTCELWSSPFQGEATFNITIEATDQLHFPVNNSIYVNYKGFTNASINSCILFYVSSSSMEEFMSNNYLRFVKALDSLFNLQASKTHVFGIKHIGGDIILLAVVKNYDGQYLSREVALGISIGHKKLLESYSNVTISHITSDPCHIEPCTNGATCNKNIYIGQDVAALESSAVIFVSPQKEIFNCSCLAGFTGTLCEDDINECEVNPCENRGTCVNTPGSFYCHCQSGFSGSFCSTDGDECLKLKCQNGGTCTSTQDGYHCHCILGFEGEVCELFIDHCRSAPCVQGSCTNSQRGFSCRCPFGVSGIHCEEHSYGFEELSFMEFPPLDRRTNLISLEFATVQRNSLLLYNPGGAASKEFIALEILNGAIHLSFDLGPGPLPAQIKTHDFLGCMRNIYVNGILLRPLMALASYNILDRCPRTSPSPCQSNPCKNSGLCRDLWSYYLCECKSPFTGNDCAEEMSEELVLRFDGKDYIEYVIKERFRRDYLLKDFLEKEGNTRDQSGITIKFKTQDDGVLIFVVGETGYTMLKIKDRKLVYTSNDTLAGHMIELAVDPPVANGIWHVLSFFSIGHDTLLLLDGKSVLNISDNYMDLTPVGLEKIIFGAGREGESNLQQLGFTGCVQYFNVSGYTLPVSAQSVMMDVSPSSTLVQSSCSSRAVCLHLACFEDKTARRRCLSPDCQNRRIACRRALQSGSCICLHNVSDQACDICVSATESLNRCSEKVSGLPLWLVALILPLTSILVIIGWSVALYRKRCKNAERRRDSSTNKSELGTDNVALRSDDSRALTDSARAKIEKQHDPTDPQRSCVEFYGDAILPSVQLGPNSHLDYYELSPSALHSDCLSDTKCENADPKRRGDSRIVLPGFKKERCSGGRPIRSLEPQDVDFLNKQLLTKKNEEHAQQSPSGDKGKFPHPEYFEPAQCLTFEEISKLNTTWEKTSPHAPLTPEPAMYTTVIGASPDSETDSTFSCSESECGQFSPTSARKSPHGQSSLPASRFGHNCRLSADQHKEESACSNIFEQWGNILNMHLPYSSYAPVFEDIACLHTKAFHSNGSDLEEII
ncbi:protocadherin Fat 4 isoform 2-T2 [Spinachia spinachia]